MGSQLRPGATGLNRIMLEQEAKIKEFLSNLLSGPSGYNEDHTMPTGPEVPNNYLAGATGISAMPSFQPDSGYGAPDKGAFGLDTFAPLIMAAMSGKTPDNVQPKVTDTPNHSLLSTLSTIAGDGPGSMPSHAPYESMLTLLNGAGRHNNSAFTGTDTTGIELPPVHGSTPTPANGSIPPEIMAIVDKMMESQGTNGNVAGPSRMAAGPPRMAQERSRTALTNPRSSFVGPPQPKPFMGPPNPEENSNEPTNLAAFMGGPNNLANAVPGPREIEPYDGPDIEADMDVDDNDPYADPDTEAYLGALRSRPQHDDFKGSRARGILSGIMKGLLGGDFGVGDAPHQKALRSWSDKNSGLKEASDIEQAGLKEKRMRDKNSGD